MIVCIFHSSVEKHNEVCIIAWLNAHAYWLFGIKGSHYQRYVIASSSL